MGEAMHERGNENWRGGKVEEGRRQPTHSVLVSSSQERAKQKHVGHTATKARRLTVRRRVLLGRLLPSLLCKSSGWRDIHARVCAVVPGI